MIRFDSMPPEVMQAMCTPMHEIPLPRPQQQPVGTLFLGSLSAVHDNELLTTHRISHLVQVMEAPWLPSSSDKEREGYNCYRIQILDHPNVELKPHLENVCNWIDWALKNGRNVLVHCQQGISRSPAVVIAYLIRNHGMSYDTAFAFLKRKRACVKPNSGFVAALREWEGDWRATRPSATRRFTS